MLRTDVVGLAGMIAFLVLALAPLLNAMQKWPRTQPKASERHKNLFESFWRLLKIPRSPLQKFQIWHLSPFSTKAIKICSNPQESNQARLQLLLLHTTATKKIFDRASHLRFQNVQTPLHLNQAALCHARYHICHLYKIKHSYSSTPCPHKNAWTNKSSMDKIHGSKRCTALAKDLNHLWKGIHEWFQILTVNGQRLGGIFVSGCTSPPWAQNIQSFLPGAPKVAALLGLSSILVLNMFVNDFGIFCASNILRVCLYVHSI